MTTILLGNLTSTFVEMRDSTKNLLDMRESTENLLEMRKRKKWIFFKMKDIKRGIR